MVSKERIDFEKNDRRERKRRYGREKKLKWKIDEREKREIWCMYHN